MEKIFNAHGMDTTLNHRTGQKIKIIRPLTRKECDIFNVGKMYRIKFPDGFITDAFEDELENINND